jgi:SAM-dependent methyltransferase
MSKTKDFLSKVPFFGKPIINLIWNLKKRFKKVSHSSTYWESTYKSGGNSGEGSYNRLAEFKAEFLNSFVTKENPDLVIEFGCGDGNQLGLIKYKNYIGLDVSQTAIKICRDTYKTDKTKSFFTYGTSSDEYKLESEVADLSISLDVIYHLLEDEVYEKYMSDLFRASKKFVIIYSSNYDTPLNHHERDHKFTEWIDKNKPEWKLINHTPNKYPYKSSDPENTSKADFYIFKKN